ncbi:oviduct-specific glycoprotein [Colletotrichum asianum]
MSLVEIEQLIKKGLIPKYLPDAMMKQITLEGQWIGYDDADTIKEKKAWADNQCFGGTMPNIKSGSSTLTNTSGLEPTNTTDGTCGHANGNTVYGDWPHGNCCSRFAYLLIEFFAMIQA